MGQFGDNLWGTWGGGRGTGHTRLKMDNKHPQHNCNVWGEPGVWAPVLGPFHPFPGQFHITFGPLSPSLGPFSLTLVSVLPVLGQWLPPFGSISPSLGRQFHQI